MEPVILTASDTFILSNFILIHDCVFFVALGAWRLVLEACGLRLAAFFLFNFRLCRARSAASPVFQEMDINLFSSSWQRPAS
jgi:hypothetical protein